MEVIDLEEANLVPIKSFVKTRNGTVMRFITKQTGDYRFLVHKSDHYPIGKIYAINPHGYYNDFPSEDDAENEEFSNIEEDPLDVVKVIEQWKPRVGMECLVYGYAVAFSANFDGHKNLVKKLNGQKVILAAVSNHEKLANFYLNDNGNNWLWSISTNSLKPLSYVPETTL